MSSRKSHGAWNENRLKSLKFSRSSKWIRSGKRLFDVAFSAALTAQHLWEALATATNSLEILIYLRPKKNPVFGTPPRLRGATRIKKKPNQKCTWLFLLFQSDEHFFNWKIISALAHRTPSPSAARAETKPHETNATHKKSGASLRCTAVY